VGHYNHRHFFLYMVFMVLGCLFLMAFGFEIAWEEIMISSG
jgi:palmitoyltransferase